MFLNSLVLGDGKPPTFNDGNPYDGYIKPYYWVDDHALLYGNNGSLDPGTYGYIIYICMLGSHFLRNSQFFVNKSSRQNIFQEPGKW